MYLHLSKAGFMLSLHFHCYITLKSTLVDSHLDYEHPTRKKLPLKTKTNTKKQNQHTKQTKQNEKKQG